MKKTLPVIIIAVIVIVGGAVYVGLHKSNSNTSSSMKNMSTANQSAASTQSQATDTVTIASFAFSPSKITIKTGATVTWTNQDSVAHTVTETDGKTGPNSGDLDKGKSFSFTYNEAGTFKYHCAVHPEMVGTVTVTE